MPNLKFPRDPRQCSESNFAVLLRLDFLFGPPLNAMKQSAVATATPSEPKVFACCKAGSDEFTPAFICSSALVGDEETEEGCPQGEKYIVSEGCLRERFKVWETRGMNIWQRLQKRPWTCLEMYDATPQDTVQNF
ncbi:hypothetical protein HPB47_001640 [Ixodes persulcatus]|uniref:Uncharacterized protein n=1 Tax=Ixodes persulcatus TaxID=34615 RepID=A0AC60PQ05_IXOPE|nr:hypothetical protein HPB47_001640 [Ixodes persulcatus]